MVLGLLTAIAQGIGQIPAVGTYFANGMYVLIAMLHAIVG
jgi:hypothetical protein